MENFSQYSRLIKSALEKNEPGIPITPQTEINAAIKRIFADHLLIILKMAPIALQSSDPEGIHKTRVALRRLRTAIKTFKPHLTASIYQKIKASAKILNKPLGNIRDLDVLNLHFLHYADTELQDDSALLLWQSIFNQAYNPATRELHTTFTTEPFLNFIQALEEVITSPSANPITFNAQENLASSVDHFFPDKILYLSNTILQYEFDPQTEISQFHRLRIDVKRFRYTLEFFSETLEPEAYKELVRSLENLQDDLGEIQDAVIADHLLISLVQIAVNQPNNQETIHLLNQYQQFRQKELSTLRNSFLHTWEEFKNANPTALLQNSLSLYPPQN